MARNGFLEYVLLAGTVLLAHSNTLMAKSKKKKANRSTAKPTPSVAVPNWLLDTRLHGILLVGLGILLYAQTLGYDYTLDDAIVIYDNMFVTQGVSAEGFKGILTEDTFFGFFKEEKALVSGGRYRPLTLLMFAVEWELSGGQPQMLSHAVNVLLYALTGWVLYLLLLQLLRPSDKRAWAYLVALVAAGLFVVHPIHTEAVANIKGRDEIMTLLGSLFALYATMRGLRASGGGMGWHALAGVSFFLALLSKETAITFVAIAPLTLYVFTRAERSDYLRAGLPWVVATVAFLVLRFAIVGLDTGEPPMELMNNPFLKIVNGQYVPFSGSERLATVLFTLLLYFKLMFVPYPLTHDYYPQHIELHTFGDPAVMLSLLLHLGMLAYGIYSVRRRSVVGYGLLFYLIALSIVSNIVFPIGTFMAERFLFVPSVGLCLAVAWAVFSQGKISVDDTRKGAPAIPANWQLRLGIVGAVAVLFALHTVTRNPVWKDNHTLFTTDVATSPNSAKLRNAAGGTTIERALTIEDAVEQDKTLRTAIGHLQQAILIHPNYKNAHLLMGNAELYLDQYDNAIASYEQALRIDPGYTDAINNLAKAHELKANTYPVLAAETRGIAYGERGQYQEAVAEFRTALDAQPQNAKLWFFLANTLANTGEYSEALVAYQQALNFSPNSENYVAIYSSMATVYRSIGNEAKAVQMMQLAEEAAR